MSKITLKRFFPFECKRLQFPVRLASAMTISKVPRTIAGERADKKNWRIPATRMWPSDDVIHIPSHLFVYAPEGRPNKKKISRILVNARIEINFVSIKKQQRAMGFKVSLNFLAPGWRQRATGRLVKQYIETYRKLQRKKSVLSTLNRPVKIGCSRD